tara:strand:- start:2388 stop:2525 length:138 start_codon:yes stop_codon:yes gene_type:complete
MIVNTKWEKPTVSELGDALELINGIPGGDKEIGTADGEFLPLQVS